MAIQIWGSELAQFLLSTYQYDRAKGIVTRKMWEGKTVRDTPIGSLSAQGDFLTVVHFKGKAWTIRLVKLAVFLETGLQYHKIETKDGNRSNLVWDNLLPLGQPAASAEEHEEQQSVITEEKIAKHKEIKTMLEKQKEDQLKARLEALSFARENKPLGKHAILRLERERVEKEREDMEKRWKEAEKNSEPPEQREMHPIQSELVLVAKPFEDAWKAKRYLTGLFTHGTKLDAEQFIEDCNKALGVKTREEILLAAGARLFSEMEDKVEHDRIWLSYWMKQRDEKTVTMSMYENMLHTYQWKDAYVKGKYGDVSDEERQKMIDALVAYSHSQGYDMKGRPLPADGTEEEVEAARVARARVLGEKKESGATHEQSLSSLLPLLNVMNS